MNRFYLAALLALAFIASIFFHPIAGLVIFAVGVMVPFIPAWAGAALLALVAMTLPALAQTAAPPASTVISFGDFYNAALPYLTVLFAAAVTALLGWVASILQKSFGITLDQTNRNALQSAAMSGVNMALSKLGTSVNSLTFDTKSAVIAQAIEYVEKSVPDALNHFGVTPQFLEDLIESKLGLLNSTPPAAAPAAPAAPASPAAPAATAA